MPENNKYQTLSNLPVERIYSPDNAPIDYLNEVGFPGEYPFTRGIHPTIYRGQRCLKLR